MVRQTHRRRQSRGRRRNTRRSRRTQRGGGMFSFLGFGSSDDIEKMKQNLAEEKDPIKKAEIQKDITCAEAEEKLEQVKKTIKEKGSTGAATGGVDSPSQLSSTDTSNSNMFRGGRRKSRRYRRK